jgi:predicted deacylase
VAEDDKDLARTCPGRDDGSVTEQIAAALTHLIRSADFYIDLHTAGSLYEILPLAGYVLHAKPHVLDWQRKMARAFNLPIVWGTSPRLEGRSLSVARDANVPAIYVEQGGGGRCDRSGVEACVEGCLNVAGALGLLELLIERDRRERLGMPVVAPALDPRDHERPQRDAEYHHLAVILPPRLQLFELFLFLQIVCHFNFPNS